MTKAKQWSFSQSEEIRRCERKWYLSHGRRAARNSRDPLLREIAFLKKLSPSWMWRGSLVHDAIRWLCTRSRAGDTIGLTSLCDYLVAHAEVQWQDSRRRAREKDPISRTQPEGPILFEHYFPQEVNHLMLESVVADALACVRRFYSWACERALDMSIRQSRSVWLEPKQPPFFEVGDVRFLTKVDLAFRQGRTFELFDWKTGKPPAGDISATSEGRQVRAYALWPHLFLGVPISDIRINVVFLGDPTAAACATLEIREEDVDDILNDVEVCIAAGMDVLGSSGQYTLQDFDFATSPRTCRMCQFQELCARLLAMEGNTDV